MPEEAPQHTPHELDIILVGNPDKDCDSVDSTEGWSHKDYFQVKWAGQPHRIAPGGTKRMMRFLADHFAKYMADHVLMKMEEEAEAAGKPRRGLVQNPVERARVMSTILLKVEEYYLGETKPSEGAAVAQAVSELNPITPGEKVMDLGEISSPAIGTLKPEGPGIEAIMKAAGEETKTTSLPDTKATSIWDKDKPKPTKAELLAEADKLGLEVSGKENVDQLIAKIKSF